MWLITNYQIKWDRDKLTEKLNLFKNRPILCHQEETVKCTDQAIKFENYAQHLMQTHKIPYTIVELYGQEFRRNYYANTLEGGPFYSILIQWM